MFETTLVESANNSVRRHTLTDRRALALSLLPGTAFMVFFVWRAGANPYGPRRFTLFDDAMVSMTYSRTFANTGELVWFPGAARVQGFTNPLWTLYMSALHRIGLNGSAAALAVSVTGVLILVLVAVLVFVLVVRGLGSRAETRAIALAAAGTVPFLYPLTYWTLRGMEVGLLALLLLTMVWAVPLTTSADGVRSPARLRVAAVAGMLGVVTRLDFALLALGVVAATAWWADDRRARLRLTLALGGSIVAAVAAVLLFQRMYWHDWLPNTYQLKIQGVVPQVRWYRGLVTIGKLLPIIGVVVLAMAAARRLGGQVAQRLLVVLTSAIGLSVTYSVWVGGDAWESALLINRYVSVVLPAVVVVVFVAFGLLLQAMPPTTIRRVAVSLGVLPVLGIAAGLSSNPYRFVVGKAFLVALVLSLVVISFVVAVRRTLGRTGGWRNWVCASVAALGLVAMTSAYSYYDWARKGGLHVADDQKMTQRGLELARVTHPDAVIAVVWSGAPAYYSSRSMIDLLGKSDPVIAASEPKGSFYPGHNKWDYEYSVGTLRPDVLFQIWGAESQDWSQITEWGYVLRCLSPLDEPAQGSYFLATSGQIRWEGLYDCST